MLKQYYGKTNMCFGEGEAEDYRSNYFSPGSASKVFKVKKNHHGGVSCHLPLIGGLGDIS